MPLDTRIALSAQPIQLENPLAQYGQFMNAIHAGTQNQLAMQQVSAAQRAAEEEEGLKNYLANPKTDLSTAEGQRGAMQYGAKGQALLKNVAERKKTGLESDKLVSEVLDAAHKSFNRINSPYAAMQGGPEAVTAYVKNLYENDILGPQAKKIKPFEDALRENLALFTKSPTEWATAHANLEGQNLTDAIKTAEARAAEARAFAPPIVTPPAAASSAAVVPTAPVNNEKAPMVVISPNRLGVTVDGAGNTIYRIDGKEVPFGIWDSARASSTPAAAVAPEPAAAMDSAVAAPAVAPAAAVGQPDVLNNLKVKIQGLEADRNRLLPDIGKSGAIKAQWEDLGKQIDNLSKGFSVAQGTTHYVPGVGAIQGQQKMHFETQVNQDGTTNIFAINENTGEATPVMQKGIVLKGVNPAMASAATRIAFDREKFDWEKANPNKTLKEVVQSGVTKYFSVDDRSGVATPVTVAGGKILSGTDAATQRLAFDQAKFAWEKANPGFTIQQTEDGSIVGVNNRTLQAYPVTLNAGKPPANVPFVGGGGGGAPATGVGRGAVGVTDSRAVGGEPAGAPVSVPLKGKSAGLTESQGNATAFGMRMKESHDLLKKLENAGATDTGYARGVIGGTLGLTPLIGDKLNDATGNIFNALPTVLGGLNEQQQQTVNARINFITAVLRKESGASIQPSEFSTAEKLYFPQPGNPPSVIAQKQKARELAIEAMKIQAGPGSKNIGAAQGEGSTSESDPLGIRK